MPPAKQPTELFSALLKYWRGKRGQSQLDLSLAADVSTRHISFLETGRGRPSREMVLRLGAALGVPLRHVNTMLTAAGFEEAYPGGGEGELAPVVSRAVGMMMEHHEPYPLLVLNRAYDVIELNDGARRLFSTIVPELADARGLNVARMTFDPAFSTNVISNFQDVGRALLWRLHREALNEPSESPLRKLIGELLEMPTVEPQWREVNLTEAPLPALLLELSLNGVELSFLTTVTVFQAPTSVNLEDLRIETWFPADEATAAACRSM